MKSITQLRSIAQGYGVKDFLAMTRPQLEQAILLKQEGVKPQAEAIELPKPAYDARLMNKPPAKITTKSDLMELLQPYIKKGLHVTFPEPEQWHMRYDKKEDTGTMRQPLRNVLKCAQKIMK